MTNNIEVLRGLEKEWQEYVDKHDGGYSHVEGVKKCLSELRAALAALGGEQGWRGIETAPKGGGAEYITDPAWVDPPHILLLFDGGIQSVGHWDWYYAEGGRGHQAGLSAWLEPVSGEQLSLHYDEPVGWMPLPPPPGGKVGG